MQSKSITFLRDVGLMLLLLYLPFFKSVAQQPTYIKPIKYTDVNFNVYFAHCDHPEVVYTVNGTPLNTTVLFASGGFIANRFQYGILKAGDTFTVTNTCDGTSISRIVEDDYSYIGIPNGSTYIGNGISPSDTDPPYTRLHTPVQLGKCEVVKNVRAHILDSYLFSMNANAHYGVFKHNGVPIKKSDYIEDHYGQTGVVWDINSDGSAYTDNPTTLTSLVSYSGSTPEVISYTHNGATITDDLTLQFGGLAIRYIKNGAYSIEKYTATQFERVDYTGNFENSTFEIRYGASKIEAWVDGVKVDELVREVVYSVSGGGSISNNSVLPYGSSVDFTPTTSGDYVITAIINNVRRVEQQIHIAIDPDGVNSVGNATCSNGTGKITANINQKGYAPLSYRINGGSWGNSNVFSNLTPGNYKIEVKDGSGCTFASVETVGFNSAIPNLTVSDKTCSEDLTTYNLNFTSDGTVTSDYGVVSGNVVSGVPAGQSVTLTSTSSGSCQTTLLVSAPSCNCPTVNAPVSTGDKVICSNNSIPTLGVTVGTNETANWYDGSGVLLSSGSTSYTPSAAGTYYAEAQNISNGCRSSSKTAVKLTINAVPNLTVSNKNCSSDLKTYNVSFTSDGTVTSDYGVVSGNVVSDIPSGQSVTLTATSVSGCQTILLVSAPICNCPTVNAPVSTGDKVICSTSSIPSLNVIVGTNETANWFDGSGALLLSGSTNYTPNAAGTYYAEAQNTTNGCKSSSKTGVQLIINAVPSLTASNKACSADLKTYNVSFASDGTVTSDYGVVSGNVVSGVPAGQSVTLTASSASGCQTTLLLSAPICNCPTVNAPVSTGDKVICSTSSIPSLNVIVGTNETANWYDGSGALLLSRSTSYTPSAAGTYHAEAQNTTNGCKSSSKTAVKLTINSVPSLTASNKTCSADLTTYNLSFTSDGTVTSDYGVVSTNVVSGIPSGQSVTLTASSASGCQTTLLVSAPSCTCPTVNAPVSIGDKVICSTASIPSLNVIVGTNETANWYDGSGAVLLSGSTSYTPSASGTYYAEAQNTTNGCKSSSKTTVKLTINSVPSLTASNKTCSADLKTYSLSFASDGTVTSDYGVVSSNMVSGIPSGQSVTLTATSVSGCQTALLVSAPSCTCPTVNTPVSTTGNQVSTCKGTNLPAISASVGVNETIDWYSASAGGVLLQSNSLTYMPKAVGTYYAEARNTINGCISSNRAAVVVIQNDQPNLSFSDVTCALNIKTYSVSFISDGSVTSDYGVVSGNVVSGIPTGQNVMLTATSASGCQTTESVVAPTCKPCSLVLSASKFSIQQGESVGLTASGCPGTFAWVNTGTEGSAIQVKPLVTTTYQGACWIDDAVPQCSSSITIEVIPCALTAIASQEVIRQGESVTLQAEGCLNGFIAWNVAGSESGVLTLSPLTTTTYTASCWYESGASSCQVSKTIIVNPCELTATASKERIRQGESATLRAEGCLNGFIAWDVSGSESGLLTVSPLTTTTYTASCWYPNTKGASSCRISKTIEVSPCELSATASQEVINPGESVTLTAEGCLNGFIAWDVKGSESGVLIVSPVTTTTYTASCWYNNSNGVSSCSISKTIVVNPCQLALIASADVINQGDTTVLTASGCINGRIVWDKVEGNEYQITVAPTISTTYKVSCYYGNVEGCSSSKTIMVNPCQLHITAEKSSIVLGETSQLKVEGCRNGRVVWQGMSNDSTTISVRPLSSTTYIAKCYYGTDSLASCEASILLTVSPCQLTSKVSKSVMTAGETLSIITTGCLGRLVYSSDSAQNGKSAFELMPTTTGSVRISCQIGDMISCDTIIQYEVQQCSSQIVVNKQIITLGESTMLDYVGCPNTVVWKGLGTGAAKRVRPEQNTMYYVSCRFGKDLAYSCSNDSILVRVKPLPPLLINNRNGLRGTAILDTVCLNTEFTIGVSCEGKAMSYTNGQLISETKFQAKSVGIETYKYYCQSKDGEQSEESTFDVLVKGFEVNDAIVYPVPTSGLLHIKSKGCLDNLHLVLYTLSGQMLYQGNGEYRDAESISIDMSYLPSDEYVLHITGMEAGSQVTKRLRVVKYSK